MTERDVLVVGAGVSGLTVGTVLADRGHGVRILAREAASASVSGVAAAIWYPYLAAPRDKVLAWGRRTFEVLADLADEPGSGTRMVEVFDLHRRPRPEPWWARGIDWRPAETGELPGPQFVSADVARVPVSDTTLYLSWLEGRFRSAGGILELGHQVSSLSEVLGAAEVVVNCTGLGAATVVPDPSMEPVRGQVVRVADPGVERAWLDQDRPGEICYIVPRQGDCVVGGTSEPGETDLTPRPEVTERILERAATIVPALADAEILDVGVGLRPARPEVRLELEWLDDTPVVHDYGHGGAGYTLSWGCAEAAADLVEGLGR